MLQSKHNNTPVIGIVARHDRIKWKKEQYSGRLLKTSHCVRLRSFSVKYNLNMLNCV